MAIIERGDSFGVRVYDQGNRVWLGSYRSRDEAEEAEASFKLTGEMPLTCEEFAERWLRDYARPAEGSRKFYEYGLKPFLRRFGPMRLAEVTRGAARNWAAQTPYYNVRAARAMFTDAVDAELVPANPLANLRMERSRGRKDLEALTEEEVGELAACASVHGGFAPTMTAWILMAGHTGIRPGESFRLEWSDIEGDELTVRGSKTKRAQRRIHLPQLVRAALEDVPRSVASPLIFLTKQGKPFSKGALYYYWKDIRARFGRHITPYELRHAYATIQVRKGVPGWAIAKQLGHADATLVNSLYGHPGEADARELLRRSYGENVADLKEASGE